MKKYKVYYEGFAYVEADSKDDAIENAQDGISIYSEQVVSKIEEVDDFIICL